MSEIHTAQIKAVIEVSFKDDGVNDLTDQAHEALKRKLDGDCETLEVNWVKGDESP